MPKNKLEPGFDPVWSSEFLDIKIKHMSRTAFILRQMYRSYRNITTNVCELSDLKIHQITGWHRRAINKARQQLIALGEIIPIGYRTYAVKDFHRYKESCAQKAQLENSYLSPKGSTDCAQKAHRLSPKGSPIEPKGLNFPVSTDTDTDKTDSFSASPVSKEKNSKTPESVSPEDMLKPEGIRTLKMLYGNNVIAIKAKLALMGITEAKADMALGRA